MRRWYCPEGWESRRLPPLGGDDGQEYGYFLPPPPLPFLPAQSFLIPSFPFPVLPPSFPAPRPCSGRGRRPVLLPARERSSSLPAACEPSRPSLRPRKPEANARVASACFLEGKSTADPLGTLCKACQCAFCMEKARIVVSHSCREMWFTTFRG